MLLDEYVYSNGHRVPLQWGIAVDTDRTVRTRPIPDADDKHLLYPWRDNTLFYWDARRSMHFHLDVGSYQAHYPITQSRAGNRPTEPPNSLAAANLMSRSTLTAEIARAAYRQLLSRGMASQQAFSALAEAMTRQNAGMSMNTACFTIANLLRSSSTSDNSVESDDEDNDTQSEQE